MSLDFKLSEEEIELLHKLHNARAVKEMCEHPGWPILQTISQHLIERMEAQHLESAGKLDRDTYWIQGAELGGARKYARLLTETIAHQISVLEQPYVPPTPIDPADYDGEI